MAKTPKADSAPAAAPDDAVGAPSKKAAPTPTRKEQEAARKRPLVPTDRRLAARQSRDQQALARERARVGMANGEEKYLLAKDKGPQKKFVRDYVDARFSVGEILLPMLVIVIIAGFLPPEWAQYGLYVAYGFILLALVDAVVVGFILTNKLTAMVGKDRVEKVRFYALMRMLQLRPIRLPKPQVKRGAYPTSLGGRTSRDG